MSIFDGHLQGIFIERTFHYVAGKEIALLRDLEQEVPVIMMPVHGPLQSAFV